MKADENINKSIVTKGSDLTDSSLHRKLIKLAILEAELSLKSGDVPVGAVIIDSKGNLVAKAHNKKVADKNGLAHAELIAISQTLNLQRDCYLSGHTIIVTLEPCAMCAGAILATRMQNLIFGAFDPKGGACGSIMNIVDDPRLNHRVNIIRGVMNQECSKMLSDFFEQKRH